MLRRGTYLFLLLNFVLILSTFAQHQNEGKESEHQVDDHQQAHKKHVISASLNHTIIFSAVKNGESKAAIMRIRNFLKEKRLLQLLLF